MPRVEQFDRENVRWLGATALHTRHSGVERAPRLVRLLERIPTARQRGFAARVEGLDVRVELCELVAQIVLPRFTEIRLIQPFEKVETAIDFDLTPRAEQARLVEVCGGLGVEQGSAGDPLVVKRRSAPVPRVRAECGGGDEQAR